VKPNTQPPFPGGGFTLASASASLVAMPPRKKSASRALHHAHSLPARGDTITSPENRWLKTFRAALRRPGPPDDGWVGIEGPRLVAEALRSDLEVSALIVSPSGERHLEATGSSSFSGCQILRTTDRLFSGIAGTETPQGIAALVRPRPATFDDLLRGGVPLVVVLVGVQDPGNVGTILRSAEAFGSTGIVVARGSAYPWAPKTLRASAGSALRLPILAGMAAPLVLAQLRIAGLKLFAATLHDLPSSAALSPESADLRGPVALLVGSEGSGLPAEIERSADLLLRIPVAAPVESLNAAIAASVLLYEAARQRGLRI
jgi:TrmH family RNA methyltransferase